MSWEDIEKEEKVEPPLKEEVDRFCSVCYEVLKENVRGRELMDLLASHFEMPVCPPDKEASYGYFREGQNNIIRQLKNAIKCHELKIGGGK